MVHVFRVGDGSPAEQEEEARLRNERVCTLTAEVLDIGKQRITRACIFLLDSRSCLSISAMNHKVCPLGG